MIPVSTLVASQIEVDDRGVAWITGANTKVTEVVLDKIAHGWSPEEMHLQHPTSRSHRYTLHLPTITSSRKPSTIRLSASSAKRKS
ncbi:MAG TPA: hypothetical protein VMT20_05250 [Terriglobia bacterium]|nr:hypothetical protein [Terriglobia bacterium]